MAFEDMISWMQEGGQVYLFFLDIFVTLSLLSRFFFGLSFNLGLGWDI